MRVPFDSLCLAAVVDECQELIGGQLQRIVQLDELTIGLGIYRSRESLLIVSADAVHARAHLVTRRHPTPKTPPPFCAALRKYVMDATVVSIAQRGLDRILEISLTHAEGEFMLIAELMGKHSNIILCDGSGKVLACAKFIGSGKSKRPVIPGRKYVPPPFEVRPSLLAARFGDDLGQFEGASPFLQKLIGAGLSLETVQSAVETHSWYPVLVIGGGAYPFPPDALGLVSTARKSISQALEEHYDSTVADDRASSERANLAGQLKRVVNARQRALVEIEKALDTASRARERQEQAELILAYQKNISEGDTVLVVIDYSGKKISISLDPKKTAVENANRLFERAKKAKRGAADAMLSREHLLKEFMLVTELLKRLETASTVDEVGVLRIEAERHRWLHHHAAAKSKEERPYQGFSIREAISPNGWTILYGENATSNDHLTTKVARPNDYWFHVRGVTSAHVVLLTQNRPTSVQMEDLMFAAQIAVNKSASKHSGYVTVDYLLKKYVRKARKSAPGAVTYSQEKTLHVDR